MRLEDLVWEVNFSVAISLSSPVGLDSVCLRVEQVADYHVLEGWCRAETEKEHIYHVQCL